VAGSSVFDDVVQTSIPSTGGAGLRGRHDADRGQGGWRWVESLNRRREAVYFVSEAIRRAMNSWNLGNLQERSSASPSSDSGGPRDRRLTSTSAGDYDFAFRPWQRGVEQVQRLRRETPCAAEARMSRTTARGSEFRERGKLDHFGIGRMPPSHDEWTVRAQPRVRRWKKQIERVIIRKPAVSSAQAAQPLRRTSDWS